MREIIFGFTRLAVLGVAVSTGTTTVVAQTAKSTAPPAQRVQLTVDYSYMRANAAPGQCGCFNLSGGSVEISVHAWRGFSVVADLTGEHASNSNIPGQTLSLLFVTAGPRFTYYPRRAPRFSPFVQGLVGTAHGFDAPFPKSSGATSQSANAFGALLGGGLDITVSHHFAIRPVQADYGISELPNNINGHQNLFRYSAGVVLRAW